MASLKSSYVCLIEALIAVLLSHCLFYFCTTLLCMLHDLYVFISLLIYHVSFSSKYFICFLHFVCFFFFLPFFVVVESLFNFIIHFTLLVFCLVQRNC